MFTKHIPGILLSICFLSSCAHVGPPLEPADIKSNKAKALVFLKSLPALRQRDSVVCRYGEQGIKNLAGKIVSYEEYSATARSLGNETIIELNLPSKDSILPFQLRTAPITMSALLIVTFKLRNTLFTGERMKKLKLPTGSFMH